MKAKFPLAFFACFIQVIRGILIRVKAMADDCERLADLSLSVAQEVDRKLGGKDFNPKVFTEFTKELSKATGIGTAGSATCFYDPMTTEVFAQAIGESSYGSISDISELAEAIAKIISPLTQANLALTDDNLSQAKRFCLSLHKSIMAQSLPPIYEGENRFEDELGFIR